VPSPEIRTVALVSGGSCIAVEESRVVVVCCVKRRNRSTKVCGVQSSNCARDEAAASPASYNLTQE
jgi:hypothetical protein